MPPSSTAGASRAHGQSPSTARSYRRRYDHRHTTPRRARAECLRRSDHTCQGCGKEPATEAHHWTYPREEETTANHLTAFCGTCHDIVTWFTWFVSFGGSRELFRELFPAVLSRERCNVHQRNLVGARASTRPAHSMPVFIDESPGKRRPEIYVRSDPIGKLDILPARLPPALRKGGFKEAPGRLLAILKDARTQ